MYVSVTYPCLTRMMAYALLLRGVERSNHDMIRHVGRV
jgi:hypothetical protein